MNVFLYLLGKGTFIFIQRLPPLSSPNLFHPKNILFNKKSKVEFILQKYFCILKHRSFKKFKLFHFFSGVCCWSSQVLQSLNINLVTLARGEILLFSSLSTILPSTFIVQGVPKINGLFALLN